MTEHQLPAAAAGTVDLEQVPAEIRVPGAGAGSTPAGGEGYGAELSLEEIEKRHILATLEHTDWNKSQAANILEIERSTLDRKIKSYQLKKED